MLVTPRKASTVSIIKSGTEGFEVLLMKRHGDDRFLPEYYVFPGGAVDEQDFSFDFAEEEKPGALLNFGGNLRKYYGYIICGIRETFEESGILLAVDSDGNYPKIDSFDEVEKFSRYRRNVFEQKISFKDMLAEEKLTPAFDRFFYMNRWVTPPLFPIRYDTRFFAVISPENQEISHDGLELIDFQWMTPSEALEKYRKNKIKLVMPTIKTLEYLNKFNSAEDVISSLYK